MCKFIYNLRIKKFKKEIRKIEQRRSRSQSVLVEAILTNKTPDDEDVAYFNMYTAQINAVRDDMHEFAKKHGVSIKSDKNKADLSAMKERF